MLDTIITNSVTEALDTPTKWSARALLSAGSVARRAMSSDTARETIHGLLVDDGSIVATDGYRLHIAPADDLDKLASRVWIPGSVLSLLTTELSGYISADAFLTIGESSLAIALPSGMRISVERISDRFPDYRFCLEEARKNASGGRLVVSATYLRKMIKDKAERSKCGREYLRIGETAIQTRYLRDAVHGLRREIVTIDHGDELSPLIVECQADRRIAVIMPMRV